MCTVTFIARKRGYCLGMNRDEKLTRSIGLPPKMKTVNGRTVLCPSEPGGGTWIALNDCGACLALINWYSVAQPLRKVLTVTLKKASKGWVDSNPVSRGEVVSGVRGAASPRQAAAMLQGLPLNLINPFRLIGIFPATREIAEWRWDLQKLDQKNHRWETRQWISSGFDEPVAQRERGRTFRQALQQRSAGRLRWLRQLHRSHSPQAGPFSTCMHRADAATVSYTEISVSPRRAVMGYHPGALCHRATWTVRRLRRGGDRACY